MVALVFGTASLVIDLGPALGLVVLVGLGHHHQQQHRGEGNDRRENRGAGQAVLGAVDLGRELFGGGQQFARIVEDARTGLLGLDHQLDVAEHAGDRFLGGGPVARQFVERRTQFGRAQILLQLREQVAEAVGVLAEQERDLRIDRIGDAQGVGILGDALGQHRQTERGDLVARGGAGFLGQCRDLFGRFEQGGVLVVDDLYRFVELDQIGLLREQLACAGIDPGPYRSDLGEQFRRIAAQRVGVAAHDRAALGQSGDDAGEFVAGSPEFTEHLCPAGQGELGRLGDALGQCSHLAGGLDLGGGVATVAGLQHHQHGEQEYEPTEHHAKRLQSIARALSSEPAELARLGRRRSGRRRALHQRGLLVAGPICGGTVGKGNRNRHV